MHRDNSKTKELVSEYLKKNKIRKGEQEAGDNTRILRVELGKITIVRKE